MLDFKSSSAAREVLFHPVMKTYLDLKWRSVKRYFFFNFACYFIFLVTYSLFLGNIFYRVVLVTGELILLASCVGPQ